MEKRNEKFQNTRRGGFWRITRGSRYTSSYRNQNLSQTNSANFHVRDSSDNCGEDLFPQFAADNVDYSAPSAHRSYNRQLKNERSYYNGFKQSEYKPYEGVFRHKHVNNSTGESYRYADAEEKHNSQRGKIVGGRYIRKHSSSANAIVSNQNATNEQASDQNVNNQFPPQCDFNDMHCDMRFDVDSEGCSHSSRNFSNDNNYKKDYDNSRKNTQFNSRNVKKYDNEVSRAENGYASLEHKHTSYNSRKGSNVKSHGMRSVKYEENKATQRELLMQHLNKGECECLVCCEHIRTKDQIWHCLSCYHIFHLRCIRKWARSPAATVQDGGWRCPACQSITSAIPYDYYCFCGKHKNPEVNYHLTPHTCGEICGRKRADCEHPCKELCHPGPCPSCLIVVRKSCCCGKTSKMLPCNQTTEETCSSVCDKILNCGVHRCSNICHSGSCLPCEVIVAQTCYCGKSDREVPCTTESATSSTFSCGNVCEKKLNCGNHTCDAVCHPGACKHCSLSIEIVKTCCCGKSRITELINAGKAKERTSCLDSIPVCGEICGKILYCGPKDNPHTCQSVCHEGACLVCPLTTSIKCRCGAFTKEFQCVEIGPSFVFLCEKRCNRRKDCGRHKCLNNCCTNSEHKCELVCNRKLSCGLHQCQEICHMGNCPTCWNVSFDELRCHCGASVLYPPIQCGTKPPECSEPCARSHLCNHDIKHTCHSEEKCPPCTALTTKLCYGKHKQCSSVMCFLDGISCGMPCLKSLPCGVHKCQLTCHAGPCLKDDAKCTQPCSLPRSCGHPCGNQCHEGPCPETPCKAQVVLTCPCGHRTETTSCSDSTKSYHLLSVTVLASKMQEIKEGQSVNLNDVLGKKSKNSRLQCNEECAILERNKRLAVALQIQNPDLSCSPGPPSYSEFLKDEAKKNPHFVFDVYDKIGDLVQLAKQSKQKCRSHAFPPMNRDQRRVIHELAEFFGCETQSYDDEPKKNVVVTAYKTKCWLPFASIMSVVQRDMGIRKGPTPVLTQRESKNLSVASVAPASSQKKKIDYFDYNE